MPGRYSAKCSSCEYKRDIAVPPRAYALPDGTEMPIESGFGWCHACGGVTSCEVLPALADVERLLAEGRIEGHQALIEEMEQKRGWLRARVSPPRCLECGATHIEQFPLGWSVYKQEECDDDFVDIPHPGCGGMLHVEGAGFSLYRIHPYQYSAEGKRLASG